LSPMPTHRYAQQSPEELGERVSDALGREGLAEGLVS